MSPPNLRYVDTYSSVNIVTNYLTCCRSAALATTDLHAESTSQERTGVAARQPVHSLLDHGSQFDP
jgi:hypothetical protein